MTCYRPNSAVQFWQFDGWSKPYINYPVSVEGDGSRHFFFDPGRIRPKLARKYPHNRFITLPCGVCFGCRIDNARSWSLRMMHETRYHDNNCFVTLTYAPEHMPANGDLNYDHLRNFFKRARHEFQTVAKPFKYFACGEYGDENLRPHYHFAGFDFNIRDLRHFKKVGDHDYFLSDRLRDVWGFGHVIVGSLEYDSAAYIARYVTKKMRGQGIRSYVDPSTGEVLDYTVQRAFQSKGLGAQFYEDYKEEIWSLDGCLYNGQYMVKPPRYYFKKLEKADPARAEAIRLARVKKLEDLGHDPELDNERDKQLLYAMEARRLQMQTLKRSL